MTKKQRINLYVTPEEMAAIKVAADKDRCDVPTWVNRKLFDASGVTPAVIVPPKNDIFTRAKAKVAMQGFDDPPEEP